MGDRYEKMRAPTIWYLAQVNRSAYGDWVTVGMSSNRQLASTMAADGYRAAFRSGRRPWGARVIPSQQLEALPQASKAKAPPAGNIN